MPSIPFSTLPTGTTLTLTPFEVSIPESSITELKTLLKLSPFSPATYENQLTDRSFGVGREWLKDAKEAWETNYDWRKHETRMNKFAHYKTSIALKDGKKLDKHFMALFSQKKDAIPICCTHGWPGSFLEFIPIFELLSSKYTPETLPYHLVAPSLPGCGLSQAPPLDQDFGLREVAYLSNQLMIGLGFDKYVAHGGDVGSFVSRILAAQFENCVAAHILSCSMLPPKDFDMTTLSETEQKGLAKNAQFRSTGTAYAQLHATRPATAGFVLSSSPLALLTWIGEKLLAWTDEDPTTDELLTMISLYWFTNTISTSLYPYRDLFNPLRVTAHDTPSLNLNHKPFGYSSFAYDIAPMPKIWVEKTGDLVFYRYHERGGHFSSLEKPEELWKDLEDFVELIWKA